VSDAGTHLRDLGTVLAFYQASIAGEQLMPGETGIPTAVSAADACA